MGKYIKPGKNTRNSMNIVNAGTQRTQVHRRKLVDLTKATFELLPKTISFADGSTYEFTSFENVDAASNTCKLCQVWQTQITGKLGGRERKPAGNSAASKKKAMKAMKAMKGMKAMKVGEFVVKR